LFCCTGSGRAVCDDGINSVFDQFRRQPAEPIGIPFSEFALNRDVLPLCVTKLAQGR
jgi:hypothetical protein